MGKRLKKREEKEGYRVLQYISFSRGKGRKKKRVKKPERVTKKWSLKKIQAKKP